MYEQNLADRQRVLGDDHPGTLGARNDLAGAYQEAGDLGRAIPLSTDRRGLRRVLGGDYPLTRWPPAAISPVPTWRRGIWAGPPAVRGESRRPAACLGG